MSSYRNLTNSPAFNIPGEGKWDVKTPSYDWDILNGQIALQSEHPKFFSKYGFIKDIAPTAFNISSSTTNITSKLNTIEYGDNTLIVAGEGGAIATSTDGGNIWTARNSGTSAGINQLIYANNIYVYVGNTGVLATSSNLVSWSLKTSGTSNNINSITYGNNTFIYVGDTGTLATSPDAETWTIRTSNTSLNINDIAYGNGKFVYVANQGVSGVSQNTVYWESTSVGEFLQYVGGKTFSRAGSLSTTSVSLTDLTGGLSSAPAESDVVFVAVATGSGTIRSQAVTGYTQVASLFVSDTYDTNLFVGYKLMTATPDTSVTIPGSGFQEDAQTVAIQVWRNVNPNISDVTTTTATQTNTVLVNPPAITTVSASIELLVIGAGAHIGGTQTYTASYLSNFLTVGANDTNDSTIGFGSISRPDVGTYDPEAWTFSAADSVDYSCASVTIALKPKNQLYNINAITYGQNKFAYVGDFGSYATSNDNIVIFEYGSSNSTANLLSVFYSSDENEFIYGAANSQLATSSTGNAASWTVINTTVNAPISDITYGQKVYLFTYSDAVTYTGYIGYLSSYTYDTFSEFKFPQANSFTLVDSTASGINNALYIKSN
jgi:hypothetical protein